MAMRLAADIAVCYNASADLHSGRWAGRSDCDCFHPPRLHLQSGHQADTYTDSRTFGGNPACLVCAVLPLQWEPESWRRLAPHRFPARLIGLVLAVLGRSGVLTFWCTDED
jgi:hypothetical protein